MKNTKPGTVQLKGRYANIEEMVRDLADEPAFVAEVVERSEQRALINHLIAVRTARGISQSDMAQKLGCTQSRISKLESSDDSDIRTGDLEAYAQVLGLEMAVGVRKQGTTLVEQVKSHTFAIRRLLNQLAEMSEGDESMVTGLRDFSVELLFNTALTVSQVDQKFKKVSEKLPSIPAPTLQSEEEIEEHPPSISDSRKSKPKRTKVSS